MDEEFRAFREQLLRDPTTRQAYEARKPVYAFAVRLAELRRRKGLSQAALARKAAVHQSEVARIESADSSPTFDMMARLLAAAGADLEISFSGPGGEVERLPLELSRLVPGSRAGRGRKAKPHEGRASA